MAVEVKQNLTQVTISSAGVAGRSGFDGTSGTSGVNGTSGVDGNSFKNWNIDTEYIVRNTEQLTFSGDYILEDSTLLIEGSDEEVEYSANKSFKKEGTIFIGGNLLLKDSDIQNDGKISVGGEVILIGNSQIVGNGIII
jgi:hypothetical protein